MSMEVEQPSLGSHHEKQTDDNDNSNWRRRLRLRKSSAVAHTVKSQIEEQKVDKESTKETSEDEQKYHQVVNTDSYKLTFTCSDCKDGTRFSPDGLINHFKNFHGEKGQAPSFPCYICNFVTPDFTTLQQHYLKCEHFKQTSSQITEHCHRGWIRKNGWKNRDVAPKQPKHIAPDTKGVIPKSKMSWTSAPFLPFSATGLLDENGKLLHPTQTLEKTKQFLERSVTSGQKWPVTLKDEPGPLSSEPKRKQCAITRPALNPGSYLPGLMEKNNISVPPDCTTKVVGFKMVDGKKHLVLKVVPSAKSDISLEPSLTQEGINDNIARPSNQMCISKSANRITANCTCNVYDSTSTSYQPQDQGHYEDCGNDKSAQLTLVRIKDVFLDVPPEVAFNAKETIELNGDVSGEERSVRKEDIPLQQINMMTIKEISDTPEWTDNLEKAANNYKDINYEPSQSQDERKCLEALASCTVSDSVRIKDFQLLSLMTETDKRPDKRVKNIDQTAGSKVQKMKNDLTSNDLTLSNVEAAMLESGITGPIASSPTKTPTDSLLISPSVPGRLCFQDSEDENMINLNSTYSNVCLDQTCTVETLEELNQSELLLQNSVHNPDLYQTIKELPVTTVSHLLDDSEVAYRGITSQSEGGSMYAQQVDMHSSKAIPVTAVTTDKESSRLSRRTEAASKKRQREPTSKDSQGLGSKSKKNLNSQKNDFSPTMPYWEPPPPDVERTLWLFPFCPSQAIKIPRRNQPVVVLNHPDTDIPEVVNIMRTVHKHKGAVQRVVLTQGTLKALSELNRETFRNKSLGASPSSRYRRVWAEGTVKERFILNLKLKRLRNNKFKVADITVNANHNQPSFTCWFCGRHFRNQEAWVGHGQRHIMEATRDWNKLFKNEVQDNGAE